MATSQHRARARTMAVLALAALAGALVLAGFALVSGRLWRVLVVLAAVAVATVGAWYGLSRRGPLRWAGATAVVLGVAALVVVTVTAPFHGLALALALVLVALSAGAARAALAGTAAESPPGTGPAIVDLTARRPVLIMNPRSGGGKVERFQLVEECRQRGITAIVLQPGDDLEQLACDAIAGGADVIGMAGGDGSQALVASVAAAHDVPYVCVPAGTRNHLALDLGVDRDDLVGALDAFADRVERRVDLATVNGRVFVNNVSMGLYARIVRSDAYRDAKLQTAAALLPDLLGPDVEPFDLRFTGPGGEDWTWAHMLLVSNNPYRLDRLIGGGRRLRLDTGRLGIAAARIDGPADAVGFVALEAAGRIRTFHGWEEWETAHFTVDSGGPIDVGVDGESMALDPPLVFRVQPGALRVRLAHDAPGATGAQPETGLSTATISSLLAVAAGRS